MLVQPTVLGQRPLRTDGQAGVAGESLPAEVRCQLVHQRPVAVVVPGDHRRERLVPVTEQDPGLPHAGHPDGGHGTGRGLRRCRGKRGAYGAQDCLGGDLDSEPVTSHSSGALPLATSRPAAVHTVTLHEVVPTSTPTSSACGISNLP